MMFKPKSPSEVLRVFLLTLVFNTLIALLLTALGGVFYDNIIFSQCIGLSIFTLISVGTQTGFLNTIMRQITHLIVSIVGGAFLGSYVAVTILGWDPAIIFGVQSPSFLNPVILGLFFGTIISYFFYSRVHLAELKNQAQQEQLQRLSGEKELVEARLKLVQAQIEPHFLFNTLANIGSLIEYDSVNARKMLEDLNRYLRTALARTRKGATNLGEEVELLNAYLSIIQIRMGKRLHYQLDIPQSLYGVAFPPLLLQPLVENAVRHGLEPKVEGGTLTVSAKTEANKLILSVSDDGLGLQSDWHDGVGLDNVFQRIKTLFGKEGSLNIVANMQGGVTSVITIPLPGTESKSEEVR